MQTLCHDIKLYETYEELLEYCKKKYDDIQKLSLPLFETTFPVVEINQDHQESYNIKYSARWSFIHLSLVEPKLNITPPAILDVNTAIVGWIIPENVDFANLLDALWQSIHVYALDK